MTMLSTQSVLFIVACMAISNPMKIRVPRPNTKNEQYCQVPKYYFHQTLTKSPDSEIEAGSGHLVSGDVSAAQSAQTADAAHLRVPSIVSGQGLAGVGHTWAVV